MKVTDVAVYQGDDGRWYRQTFTDQGKITQVLEGDRMTQVSYHPYDSEFPPEQGPPPVKNYSGAKVLRALKPRYTVELDAGAFRALWELLESEAKHRFPTAGSMAAAAAYLRAVTVFRDAYWAVNERVEPPAPESERKRLVRKTAGATNAGK